MKRNKRQNLFRSPKFIVIFLIIILIGATALLEKRGIINLYGDSKATQDDITLDQNGIISLTPPTENEKIETEQHKKELIKESTEAEQLAQSGNQKQSVTPVIGFLESSSEGVKANGSVSEVIESNGTCTLILQKQGKKLTISRKAMPDAQSTVCGLMIIEKSKLTTGEWKATLTYSSLKYQGISKERTINVNY